MAQRLWRALRGQQNPLPPANPNNWPNPTMDDVRERPTRYHTSIPACVFFAGVLLRARRTHSRCVSRQARPVR